MDVSATKLDAKMLDSIVKRTVEAIEESKSEIYDVYEAACGEVEKLRRDLLRLKEEAATTIDRVDKLEIKEKQARINLMEVSKCFRQFSEEDVRKAYDMARDLQVELAVARECELNLRLRRDEMELRLRTLELTAHKAQRLVSQVGAVLGYLGTQMDDVVVHIESLQQTQRLGAQIIHAQEEERRRVAREIHDGPAQTMANLVFRTEICERMVDRDSQRAKAELADLREQVFAVPGAGDHRQGEPHGDPLRQPRQDRFNLGDGFAAEFDDQFRDRRQVAAGIGGEEDRRLVGLQQKRGRFRCRRGGEG